MNNRLGNIALIILPILLLVFAGVGGYLYLSANIKTRADKQELLTWEECIKIPGASVQKSYPAKCATPDGRSVTQTLSEEEKKKLQSPEETANWRLYENETYGFSFKYPPSSEIVQQESPKTIRLNSIQGGHSGRGYNFVIEPIFHETSSLETVSEARYSKMKNCGTNTIISELISTQVDQENAYIFEFNNCFGGPATEAFVHKDGTIYHISMLYSSSSNAKIGDRSEDKDKVLKVLSTFKFLDRNSTDGTANWKEYKNSSMGFSISFPITFVTESEENGSVFFKENSNSGRRIQVTSAKNPTNAESRSEKFPLGPPINDVTSSFLGVDNISSFSLQSFPAAKGSIGALPQNASTIDHLDLIWHILKGETLWEIEIGSNLTQKDVNQSNKIFSTFKFL